MLVGIDWLDGLHDNATWDLQSGVPPQHHLLVLVVQHNFICQEFLVKDLLSCSTSERGWRWWRSPAPRLVFSSSRIICCGPGGFMGGLKSSPKMSTLLPFTCNFSCENLWLCYAMLWLDFTDDKSNKNVCPSFTLTSLYNVWYMI